MIIASNEWVIVHLIIIIFTSKPGEVRNSTSFPKVFQNLRKISRIVSRFFMQMIYTSLIYIFIWKNKDFHFLYTLKSGFNYPTLVVTICSVLCYIQSYLQLHQAASFMSYYNNYIIIQITNLIWMAWLEQYQTEQDQYRESWKFSLYLYTTIFLTICTFMIVHPKQKIRSYL